MHQYRNSTSHCLQFWTFRVSSYCNVKAHSVLRILLNNSLLQYDSNPSEIRYVILDFPTDLCHKQINKKQTSIRCNHTHNTHWVHLKCTQIKQRQYKPDWRCTIHTPTNNNNTKHSPSQTNYHPLSNNNQPKDKNMVILQININGIRNKIEELKKTRTQHPTGHHHNTRNKTHTES